jgi:ribosomal protein L11 methyltransferase
MSLRRVAIRVPAAEAEIARARLLPFAPTGFEEVEMGAYLELAAYTDSPGEERIRRAFEQVSSTEVEPGWQERWREYHTHVRAGGLWLGPPWESPRAGEPAVVVDPGRAFGTGAHPTTRLCIELLSSLDRGSLLDAGCGSGVVAVAAARLGFAPVYAIDVDPDAVDAARGTVSLNDARVSVEGGDVLSDELPPVDVVVANIELRVGAALLERRPAATAIVSGYLSDDLPRVPGWTRVSRAELDGWAADVLVAE